MIMIHSFLLIGQSNMAGRGEITDVKPIDNPNIKVLRNGRWQNMYIPVNPDRVFSGVNLAESFADVYSKEHSTQVGLIPCADGGTSLDQWREGGLLFDNAIYQTRLASRTSTVAGILWHQGESDCKEDLYPFYEEKLKKIINAFRKEKDLEDVPFMVGGLGDFLINGDQCSYRNYTYINEALKNISKECNMVRFVSASGLKSKPDNLHFNSESLREFGIRYYNEFKKIENKNRVFTERPDPDESFRTELELL